MCFTSLGRELSIVDLCLIDSQGEDPPFLVKFLHIYVFMSSHRQSTRRDRLGCNRKYWRETQIECLPSYKYWRETVNDGIPKKRISYLQVVCTDH